MSWTWISRSVEPTVEKWLLTPSSIVLVRGHRRCGKSSTVRYVAEKNKKGCIIVYIVADNIELLKSVSQIFKKFGLGGECSTIFDIIGLFLGAIKAGYVVVLEEIQNASDSLQVALQQCCDDISFQSMHQPQQWRTAGALFMMGSLPGLVDSLFESRRNPLFQRLSATITVYSFDTLEIVDLYRYLGVTNNPELLLSLHTLFSGRPYMYRIAHKANLFHGADTDVRAIVKEFFASELQSEVRDAGSYLETQLGTKYAIAVKAVNMNKEKGSQINTLSKELNISPHEAFSMLHNDLFQRYGVIRPLKSSKRLDQVSRFDVCDPLVVLATCSDVAKYKPTVIRREDVVRNVFISDETLEKMEGTHWELWVREIAQDRHLLCNVPSFPTLETNDVCVFAPALAWDVKVDAEIDVIASQPATNTIIFGSCKRSLSKVNCNNLDNHILAFQSQNAGYADLLKLLKLKTNDLRVMKLHFIPSGVVRVKPGHYVITLKELLAPFHELLDHRTSLMVPSLGSYCDQSENQFASAREVPLDDGNDATTTDESGNVAKEVHNLAHVRSVAAIFVMLGIAILQAGCR